MRLTTPTFERLTLITEDISTVLDEFNDARDEYADADDAEDRQQARTSALEAIDAITSYAEKLGDLRAKIEE